MKLIFPLISGAIFLISHLICHFFNLYFLIWWTDIALHIIAGVTAALFFWWIRGKYSDVISIITFATTISVIWEFWEFSNWRYAFLRDSIGKIQEQYYPYLGNNLGDIFWGMMGGISIALVYIIQKNKNE